MAYQRYEDRENGSDNTLNVSRKLKRKYRKELERQRAEEEKKEEIQRVEDDNKEERQTDEVKQEETMIRGLSHRNHVIIVSIDINNVVLNVVNYKYIFLFDYDAKKKKKK
eukprot:24688_1